jgi:hypothetical protein
MTDQIGIVKAEGDLFPTLAGISSSKGVAINAPPAEILGTVSQMVRDAMAALPEGDRAELVGIASRHADGKIHINLAFATRVNNHVDVVGFAGKTWGEPLTAGVMTRIHF